MNKKEIITLRESIPTSTSKVYAERVKDNGTIESVKLRFYSGQEMQLKVLPYIRRTGNRIEYLTTSPNDNKYIYGDDDYFILDVVIPVYYDDEIIVEVINESPTYAYDLSVDITIDYYMGDSRVIGGVS